MRVFHFFPAKSAGRIVEKIEVGPPGRSGEKVSFLVFRVFSVFSGIPGNSRIRRIRGFLGFLHFFGFPPVFRGRGSDFGAGPPEFGAGPPEFGGQGREFGAGIRALFGAGAVFWEKPQKFGVRGGFFWEIRGWFRKVRGTFFARARIFFYPEGNFLQLAKTRILNQLAVYLFFCSLAYVMRKN